MPRILKSGATMSSADAVLIPDAPPPSLEAVTGEEGADAAGRYQEIYASVVARAKEESERVAGQITSLAHKEREQILQKARQEAEALRQQAYEEGLAQGTAEKAEQIEDVLAHVRFFLQELKAEHEAYMNEYARELKGFAADIAGKVLYGKIEEDSLALQKLVREAVASVRGVDWISVEVSEQLPALVKSLEEELSRRDFEARVEVAGRDQPKDAIYLQTSEGVVDLSVSTQLQNLRELFREMDEQEEEA